VCGTQRARTHTATLVPSPRLRYPTCTACMVRSVLYENTCRGRCELTPPRAPPLPRAVRLRHRPLMPGTCGRSQPRTPHRWRGRGNGVGGKPSVARRGAAPPPCTHRVQLKKIPALDPMCSIHARAQCGGGAAAAGGRARLSDYGALRHRAGLYAAAPPPRGDERPRGVCVSPACWLWAAPHRWVK
jgi:hypothetical protein